MRKLLQVWVVVLMLFCGVAASEAGDAQIIAGAGPSTGIVTLFFEGFSKLPEASDTNFTVMAGSVKHAGGLKNSETYLFGRTGRPLNEEEKASGKEEILLGRVQIGFAVGLEAGVKAISLDDLKKIYKRKIKNWKELGGADAPIVLLGREPTESAFMALKQDHAWFREVAFDQEFKKDDEVIKFLGSPLGRHALAFGIKSQLPAEQLLEVANLRSGLGVGLVFDRKNDADPLVKAAKQFAASKEWRKTMEAAGYRPI